MKYPYLQHLASADDPEEALSQSDNPEQIARRARQELDDLVGESSGNEGAAPGGSDGGSGLSEAKAAAKRALPSGTELTPRNVATSTSAAAAFTRNLPDDVTLSEALDELE